jgi:hypothetical protein
MDEVFLTWTLAAFGEEMVYRGYLVNRIAGIGHYPRQSRIGLQLIMSSSLFGTTSLLSCFSSFRSSRLIAARMSMNPPQSNLSQF